MPENNLKSEFPKSLTSSRYEDLKAHQTRPASGSDLIREIRPAPGTDLLLRIQGKGPSKTPSQENASQSSPDIDTIEYLKPATEHTPSNDARTHTNIVPIIDINIGTLEPHIYTLKNEIRKNYHKIL